MRTIFCRNVLYSYTVNSKLFTWIYIYMHIYLNIYLNINYKTYVQ